MYIYTSVALIGWELTDEDGTERKNEGDIRCDGSFESPSNYILSVAIAPCC